MNILEFLKNGSGIHIKKKNRGKFTKYCHGKVTNECILKGKNSSNPAIRKRATFAANARKWKHRFGGLINKFLQGGAGWGLLASGVINAGMLLYTANKLANAEKESAYANNKLNYQNLQELIVKDSIEKMNQEKKKWLEQYLSGQSLDNSWRSDAFTNYVLQLIINQKLVGAKNKLKQLNALAEAEAESEKADAMSSAFSTVIQNGLGTLISNLGNKKTINNSVNSYNSNNFRGTPDSSDKIYTTPSGISNTIDEWRNLIIR